MPRKKTEIDYKFQSYIITEDGQSVRFEDASEELKQKLYKKKSKAECDSLTNVLSCFSNDTEVWECYLFAILRIVQEHNLKLYKAIEAMKILGKKIENDDPDLEKYFFEPIDDIKITINKKTGEKNYQFSF